MRLPMYDVRFSMYDLEIRLACGAGMLSRSKRKFESRVRMWLKSDGNCKARAVAVEDGGFTSISYETHQKMWLLFMILKFLPQKIGSFYAPFFCFIFHFNRLRRSLECSSLFERDVKWKEKCFFMVRELRKLDTTKMSRIRCALRKFVLLYRA